MTSQPAIQNWSAILSNPLFWLHYYRIDPEYYLENEYALKPAVVSREAVERIRDKFSDRITQSDWEGFAFNLYRKDRINDDQAEFSEMIIPFSGGYHIAICFWVQGEYFTLHHPSRSVPLELGFDDPHFRLPIFRFNEMKALTDATTANRGPEYGLLLAKTASTSEVNPQEASNFIAQRLEALGLYNPEEVKVICAMVQHNRETKYRWMQDMQKGWVNDFPHSHRNPKNGWSEDDFAFFGGFLKELGIN